MHLGAHLQNMLQTKRSTYQTYFTNKRHNEVHRFLSNLEQSSTSVNMLVTNI